MLLVGNKKSIQKCNDFDIATWIIQSIPVVVSSDYNI